MIKNTVAKLILTGLSFKTVHMWWESTEISEDSNENSLKTWKAAIKREKLFKCSPVIEINPQIYPFWFNVTYCLHYPLSLTQRGGLLNHEFTMLLWTVKTLHNNVKWVFQCFHSQTSPVQTSDTIIYISLTLTERFCIFRTDVVFQVKMNFYQWPVGILQNSFPDQLTI